MVKKTVFGLAFAVAVIAAGCGAECAMESDVDVTGVTAKQKQDFRFTVKDGEVTITGYTGSATDIVIPDTINGLPVTVIGDYAFRSNPVVSVTIGAGVAIGAEAFPGDLGTVYVNGGKAAGTYTRDRADSTAWTQE